MMGFSYKKNSRGLVIFNVFGLLLTISVGSLIINNDVYAANNYEVVGGVIPSSIDCTEDDYNVNCAFETEMIGRPWEDNSSGVWSDFLCARFGYNYGFNVANSTSWEPWGRNEYNGELERAARGSCGSGWYQMGVFTRNVWDSAGDIYYRDRKGFKMSFSISKTDLFNSAKKTWETNDTVYYDTQICVHYNQYWYVYGKTNKDADYYSCKDVHMSFPREKYSLNTYGRNIYDASALDEFNKVENMYCIYDDIVGGCINEVLWSSPSYYDSENYKFIGWKTEHNLAGIDGLIRGVKEGDGVTYEVGREVSNSYYDNGKLKVLDELTVRSVNERDEEIYAYYAPECHVYTHGLGYVNMRINRVSSYYDKIGYINEFNSIYRGDKFTIDLSAYFGYSFNPYDLRVKGFYEREGDAYIVTGETLSQCSDIEIDYLASKNEYEGRASVSSNDESVSTDYVDENRIQENNNAAVLRLNCPSDGCSVDFSFGLRASQNSIFDDWWVGNETMYAIYKNNKMEGSWEYISSVSRLGTDIMGPFTVDMHSGEVVCYKMEFYAVPADYELRAVEACAIAEVDEGSDLGVRLKDEDSSESYRDWRTDYVYAKPGDTVKVEGYFEPYYQYLHDARPYSTKIGDNVYENGGKTIEELFNTKVSPRWNNAFNLWLPNCGGSYMAYSGFSDRRFIKCDRTIYDGNVGQTMEAIVALNRNEYGEDYQAKTTPSGVSLKYEGGKFRSEVKVDDRSEKAEIRIPYNFKNRIEFNDNKKDEKDRVLYAGTSQDIDFKVYIGKKFNRATNGYYATIVPSASGWIWKSVGGGEWQKAGWWTQSNLRPNEDGIQKRTVQIIDDVPAGTKICFRVELSPENSGSDTNLSTGSFSGVASDEVCYTVAKKPSFQVWGGSIYSSGGIETSFTIKAMGQSLNKRMFGSWAELGLIAGGNVSGLSSGAGMGYYNTDDALRATSGETLVGLGGVEQNVYDYCSVSTLSFANDKCNSFVGGLNSVSGGDIAENRITEYISDVIKSGDGYESISDIGDNHNIGSILNGRSGIIVTEEEWSFDLVPIGPNTIEWVDVLIPASITIEPSKTVVVDAKGKDIVIDRDIKYGDSGYDSLEEIPKLIIYASSIKINCDVERVDAVLIADNNIDTCANAGDENDGRRSNQLRVNGSIIANDLTLGRTYGAGPGNASIIPAEIVNYDSSLPLWANKGTENIKSGELEEVFSRSLAPRY